MAEVSTGYACRVCGERHNPLPLSFSVKAPHAIAAIPRWQRKDRVVITPDLCIIDGAHCYVRGRIVVPVVDHEAPFIWGVWAQVTARHFYRTHQLWTRQGRETEQPFLAKLATDLPLFGSTLGLAVSVQTQVVGRRPHFRVCSERHPLGAEQRHGVCLERAAEIAAMLRHDVRQNHPEAAFPGLPDYTDGGVRP